MLRPERAPALDHDPPSAQAWKPHMDSKMAASRPHHHPRVEDDAPPRGAGHFIADRSEPKQATGRLVPAPHARAPTGRMDGAPAPRAPGVRAAATPPPTEPAPAAN